MAEVTLNNDNFKAETSSGVVLVDFWAPWCGPCLAMMPVVEEITKDYKSKAKVGKLNIDENPETAQKFGVMSIPTFKILKDGQEVGSLTGAVGKDKIVEELDKAL
ncbi:MAG: thioredoxin [Patescibacteria group bacterium]